MRTLCAGESCRVGAGSQLQSILAGFPNQLSPVNKGCFIVIVFSKQVAKTPRCLWSCHDDDDDDDDDDEDDDDDDEDEDEDDDDDEDEDEDEDEDADVDADAGAAADDDDDHDDDHDGEIANWHSRNPRSHGRVMLMNRLIRSW